VGYGRVTHRPNWAGIDTVLRGPTGGVRRDLLARGHRVRTAAQRFVGVDTGRLRASLEVIEQTGPGGRPEVRVGSGVAYAWVHHQGRGPVYPVRARALRFRPKGARGFIFRRSVGPAAGTFYLKRALPFARR
jgi:hypothetical protein